MYQVKEQDWKLFRQRLPDWQEAYMDRLNQEYIRLLSGEGLASDKFWELENTDITSRRGSFRSLVKSRIGSFTNIHEVSHNWVIAEFNFSFTV